MSWCWKKIEKVVWQIFPPWFALSSRRLENMTNCEGPHNKLAYWPKYSPNFFFTNYNIIRPQVLHSTPVKNNEGGGESAKKKLKHFSFWKNIPAGAHCLPSYVKYGIPGLQFFDHTVQETHARMPGISGLLCWCLILYGWQIQHTEGPFITTVQYYCVYTVL